MTDNTTKMQTPYGDVLQATIGKRNREQTVKAAAKVGTTSSIAARVVALEEIAKKG
jgi:hypothetical protein